MSLLDQIAAGGTNIASPIQRYQQAKSQMVTDKHNSLVNQSLQQSVDNAPELNRLTMLTKQQNLTNAKTTDAVNQQALKTAKINAYRKNAYQALLPVAQIQDPAKREAAYQLIRPSLVAGADETDVPELKGTMVSQNYDPQAFNAMAREFEPDLQTPVKDEQGNLIATKTPNGKYSAVPESMLPNSGKRTTQARKMKELIRLGVDPKVAEGIAYNTYKISVDPTTGDVIKTDLRVNKNNDKVPDIIRTGDRKERLFDSKVESLSKAVEKSGIVEQENALKDVEIALNEILKDDTNADIPGFGEIAGSLHPLFLSTEGGLLRQKVARIFNQELKDRSGGAVTSNELKRLREEFSSGALRSEKGLLDGLKRYRNILDKHKLSLTAGYDDNVLKTFEKRADYSFGRKNNNTDENEKDDESSYKVGRFQVEVIKE